jgi:hypothetical protein
MTAQRRSGGRTETARTGGDNGRRAGASGLAAHIHVHDAGEQVGRAAQYASAPALAAAAGVAGLAAGLMLAARGRRQVLGIPIPGAGGAFGGVRRGSAMRDVVQATRSAQSAACQMGELAAEIRKVREQAQSMHRRSPIEVLLQGLTRRPES